MTEQELELVRAKMKTEALTVLVLALCNVLSRSSTAFLPSLLDSAKQKQNQYQKIAVHGLSPEYSDLLAGEFQDAFSDLIGLMEKSLSQRAENS